MSIEVLFLKGCKNPEPMVEPLILLIILAKYI